MRNLVFVDTETTGLNPLVHQMYEFAAIPMIEGVIRLDKAWHCYIEHDNYTFDPEVLKKFGERITKRPEHIPSLCADDFRDTFNHRMVTSRPTFAGFNVGGFDMQFIKRLIPKMEGLVSYRYIEVNNLYVLDNDTFVPGSLECVRRATNGGAKLRSTYDHTALNDALCAAELYSWAKWQSIQINYGGKF